MSGSWKMALRWTIVCYVLAAAMMSCAQQQQAEDDTVMHTIRGRAVKEAIYRVRVPSAWIRRDPLPSESLTDTTQPLVEFLIHKPEAIVRIAIHNFPADSMERRISPEAQVARWKRQFNASAGVKTPIAFSGYSGLFFKGNNNLDGVLAWSLQLAPEHFITLTRPTDGERKAIHREMCADVTIKATGLTETIKDYEEEITNFAHSFELIEEIPVRS